MKNIKTLAIVDDDEIYVFLTKKVVEQTHLVEQIKVFDNGRDAINYLKENLEIPELLPEMILLDLSLPVMDGWEFLNEYAMLKPKIKKTININIVSSTISPDELRKIRTITEVSEFIIKPITKEKFVEIVQKI